MTLNMKQDLPVYYGARILRVVDGTTVDALIRVGFDITAMLRLRLEGIKGAGEEAAARLRELILNEEVLIEPRSKDEDHWQVRIIHGDVGIRQLLIQEGLAAPT